MLFFQSQVYLIFILVHILSKGIRATMKEIQKENKVDANQIKQLMYLVGIIPFTLKILFLEPKGFITNEKHTFLE